MERAYKDEVERRSYCILSSLQCLIQKNEGTRLHKTTEVRKRAVDHTHSSEHTGELEV